MDAQHRPVSNPALLPVSPSNAAASTSRKVLNHKLHKPHTAAHGRLPHAKNVSYGKNLNKAGKTAAVQGTDEGGLARHHHRQKSQTPLASPTGQNFKRNSSNISLPRTGSKTSFKRNSSNISLKHNGASREPGKAARPVTPSRRSQEYGKNVRDVKAGSFSVGSDGQDDEWTEESNSRSPTITRRSSGIGMSTAQQETPPDEAPISHGQTALPDSPPESPLTDCSTDSRPEINHVQRTYKPSNLDPRPHHSNVLTSRLLGRASSQNLQPQVTSVSAISASGAYSPLAGSYNSRMPSNANLDQSMPDNGVSHFLNSGSNGSNGTPSSAVHLQSALSHLQMTSRSRAPSPKPGQMADSVRRAKSAYNIRTTVPPTNADQNIGGSSEGRRSPPSFTFDPLKHRRAGGNTQAKLDLWRTQVNTVEPPQSHRNTASTMAKPAGSGGIIDFLGAADGRSRVRMWEKANSEMRYLRRFRNPTVEGAARALWRLEKDNDYEKPRAGTPTAANTAMPRSEREHESGLESSGSVPIPDGEMDADRERDWGGRLRAAEGASRPVSAAGRRNVRFEMIDADAEEAVSDEDEGYDEEQVEDILRRWWDGDGGDGGGDEGEFER